MKRKHGAQWNKSINWFTHARVQQQAKHGRQSHAAIDLQWCPATGNNATLTTDDDQEESENLNLGTVRRRLNCFTMAGKLTNASPPFQYPTAAAAAALLTKTHGNNQRTNYTLDRLWQRVRCSGKAPVGPLAKRTIAPERTAVSARVYWHECNKCANDRERGAVSSTNANNYRIVKQNGVGGDKPNLTLSACTTYGARFCGSQYQTKVGSIHGNDQQNGKPSHRRLVVVLPSFVNAGNQSPLVALVGSAYTATRRQRVSAPICRTLCASTRKHNRLISQTKGDHSDNKQQLDIQRQSVILFELKLYSNKLKEKC